MNDAYFCVGTSAVTDGSTTSCWHPNSSPDCWPLTDQRGFQGIPFSSVHAAGAIAGTAKPFRAATGSCPIRRAAAAFPSAGKFYPSGKSELLDTQQLNIRGACVVSCQSHQPLYMHVQTICTIEFQSLLSKSVDLVQTVFLFRCSALLISFC